MWFADAFSMFAIMQQSEHDATDGLVDDRGRVRLGRFEHTLARINGRSASRLNAMGRPAGRLARHFGYKQFQYFGLISERFLLGCALADTAWLGVAFVYLYDTATGELKEWTWKRPLGRALHLSASPRRGESRLDGKNVSLCMAYEETGGGLIKRLHIDLPELKLEATLVEGEAYQPMSLCTRTGVSGFTYANKVAGVPADGHLTWGGETRSLATLEAYGHHDFTAGYLRRRTYWNWACTSTRLDGHDLGFNLSCGVNETSFSENCLWRDGILIQLGGIHFEYDRRRLFDPWRITDEAGHVDLIFTPGGCHEERMNLGLFASNFHQLFGRFEGRLRSGETTHELVATHGFVEQQYAKW